MMRWMLTDVRWPQVARRRLAARISWFAALRGRPRRSAWRGLLLFTLATLNLAPKLDGNRELVAQVIRSMKISRQDLVKHESSGIPWAGTVEQLPLPLRTVVQGMREQQQRLMETPGGIRITYMVEVEQAPRNGPVAFDSAIGETRLLWPMLYNRFGAVMGTSAANAAETVREGSHDFSAGCGVSLDTGRAATITPYRNAWTCHHLFSLRPLYWPWSDQHFLPDQRLPGDYWIPDALANEPLEYHEAGQQDVAGASCGVWRKSSTDALWIAPERGFLLLRRERRVPATGKVAEQLVVEEVREWAPGVWFPVRLRQSFYSQQTGEPSYAYLVTIDRVEVGGLSPADVTVNIPDSVVQIEDQVRQVVIRNPRGEEPILSGLNEARTQMAGMPSRGTSWLRKSFLMVAICLGLTVMILSVRRWRQAVS